MCIIILGMVIPSLIGILIIIIGIYIKPYYWVDEFIPYYMEIMGVDRPIAHMNLKPGGIFRVAMFSLQEGIHLQMSRRV